MTAPTFTPSHEWQEVPENALCPPGLKYSLGLGKNGKKYARLDDNLPDPPLPEIAQPDQAEQAGNVTPSLAACVLCKLIDGQNVNGYNDRLSPEYQEIATAILAEPPNPTGRARAFEAAIAGRQDAATIRAAVLAADPGADLNELIPSPKTFEDIGRLLGPISWAWPGWLAHGFVTILASESGTGKSALALALCDCFLRGKPWPDGKPFTGETGSVLWCEAEAAQAINLERATAWGLPLSKIYAPLADPLDDLNLSRPEHRTALLDIAHRPEIKLIVIDSLSGADSKAEKGTEESMTVKWLSELARDITKPIMVNHHLRKRSMVDTEAIALDQVRGASAIVQTARVVWALDTPDPQSKDWKRLQVIKSNLAKFPEHIGICIDANGVKFGAAPEEHMKETQTDKAKDLLLSLLRKAPRPATEIETEFDQAGISKATMKRAKEKLSIVSIKDHDGWKWSLPAKGQYET